MSTKKLFSTEDVVNELGIDFSPSSLVTLNYEKINFICNQIRTRQDFIEYHPYKWDNPHFWNVEDSTTNRSQFFAIGNAINFRYWYMRDGQIFPAKGIKKGEKLRGAMYMWRCLLICLKDQIYPLLDASFLASITETEFRKIFSDDTGNNPLEVGIEDRIKNLRDLGSKLLANWNGLFFNVVRASKQSLVEFAKLSRDFIAYEDPYYKLTMVNAILHSGSGIIKFDSHLLPGIDYQLLKQLLRIGILLPAPTLTEKLKNKQILTRQEAEELRRTALKAFVLISTKTAISGEILDNKWWLNRSNCTDASPICLDPRTASKCPFYGPCNQHVEFTIPLEITRYY